MNEKHSFFAELKRRNVYKVAIAYAVVAWLLIQVATQVFPFFEIPNWAVRLVVLVIIIGFPISLIIAWAFELTPEGFKRTEIADAVPTTRRSRHRVWIYVVIIAGVLSICVFFLGRYTAGNQRRSRLGEAATGSSIPQKSIAVLPFENLSHDPDNAYFADGIQEEILTRLSKIADLKVISRTSTQRFKSAPDNLLEIARQLGVANILEGSVQRSADQVRVNVQLIKAATDTHLWADTFDRKLTDVFAVESDIARAVADILRAKLSGAEQSAIAARPTENSEAHELYLRGRYFFGKRGGVDRAENLKRAIDYFNQAIAKDPNYASAYAGIAGSYALLGGFTGEPHADVLQKAKVAAEKALALDDKVAEAHVSRGLLFVTADLNFKEAKLQLERAIELNPNYADAHYFLGIPVLAPLGQFDKAIAEANRAIELDPFSVVMNSNLGSCYLYARRYPEAIAQFRKAVEMDPSVPRSHGMLAVAYEFSGHREQAITEYQKALAPYRERSQQAYLLASIYTLKGERAKVLELLDESKPLAEHGEVPAVVMGYIYVRLGDKNKAMEWLERSYQNKEFGRLYDIKVDPELDPLRGDPRFEALVQKVVGPEQK